MSVEFEPVRLGRRGRRVDPVGLGAVAVAFAVGLAVIKPWAVDAPSSGGAVAASPSAGSPTASAAPTAAPDVVLPRVITARSDTSLNWRAIEGVVRPHDAWGIRTIVMQVLADSPVETRRRYVERWYPLPVVGDAGSPVTIDSNDRAILALGVTFPPAHTPLDVRVWRQTDVGLEWVDIESLDPVPSGGAFLYRRPGLYPAMPRTWESGASRIDVLVDGRIRRFEIDIPHHFVEARTPDRPSLHDQGLPVDLAEFDLADLPVGLFATVNGVAVGIDGSAGGPLDEVGAWLDVDPGTGREPRSFVATEHLPGATGLGVKLPDGSIVMMAKVARLAPEPMAVEPERIDTGWHGGTASAFAAFRAPGGGWEPGVYRLSVRWADVVGLHDRSWHVELTPGPVRGTPRLLAAARDWARYAGETGVILGATDTFADGSRSAAIRTLDLRPGAGPVAGEAYPASTGVGCGGSVVDGRPGILGFSYPTDRYATEVRARILLPFLRRDDTVLLTAAFGVRGLILAAPARVPALPNATWRFTVGGGATSQTHVLCLGMATFDD